MEISAVTLVTGGMASAVAFYEKLGFAALYGGPSAEFTSFRVGGGYLNLQLDAGWEPRTPVWGRTIFYVDTLDDVDALHARAVAAGLAPLSAPVDAPWHERYFHIRDPDGHELSFAHPLAR